MKEIKLLDLLISIATHTNIPEKIVFRDIVWNWNEKYGRFMSAQNENYCLGLNYSLDTSDILNEKAIIIEE